jgi:hypothetical protein
MLVVLRSSRWGTSKERVRGYQVVIHDNLVTDRGTFNVVHTGLDVLAFWLWAPKR